MSDYSEAEQWELAKAWLRANGPWIVAGIAIGAGLLGGCSPATLLNATVSRQGFTREADIAYGTDPRQKLDLYRPDTPRATPTPMSAPVGET